MPSILDYFKPVGKEERPPKDNLAVVLQENKPAVALDSLCSTSDARQKLRKSLPTNDDVKPLSHEASKFTGKRQHYRGDSRLSLLSSSAVTLDQTIELSLYEKKRQKKMAANARFLEKIGMSSTHLELTKQVQGDHTRQANKRAKAKLIPEKHSVRRSRRLRGNVASEVASESRILSNECVEKDVKSGELDTSVLKASFVESNVLKYTVNDNHSDWNSLLSSPLDNIDRELVGYHVASQSYLYDNALKKTYSISFTSFKENGLGAMGGHGGLASIFALSDPYDRSEKDNTFAETHKPLMSFKAHNGWIAALSFAQGIQERTNLLFTVSNDASLKLWDLNYYSHVSKTPKEVFTITNLHEKGIFGLDVKENSIITCSKDTTIALSQLRTDTSLLVIKQRFKEHEGVVKCVRFSHCHPQLFASGGNDRVLRVHDVRLGPSSTVVMIPSVHSRAINSVQFHPTNDNLVLSAGFDPDFYMFDVRNTLAPVCTYRQYNNSTAAIFHPLFIGDGSKIVAAREHDLTLYRTSDGDVISCGYIDKPATCIAADPFNDRIAIAQGGHLRFANAKWETKRGI
ncbi:Nucleosome remodeling factor, subunit CAF1/NURF55/MSI1 [Plasmopara halstedii]|uniref:Nucleosome remodeling factor, subunit CAF1/NURF55/MSI1 n=1 Tax=Plasmopara halstedii TaxID=4781 RepID=A0A0P1AWI3_PLAHL|nr:Nucleosome remodeling factor, subunit CAF1/NURF55/MSI1 [Plasmopara halstedii]CEG46777.1 Nucleosome remodeling factor, subunit CAF1/NURF55/MSI1 [Plasmopara halstedii]|eukprot:XP_024583146.1 Nucleosome remodeling factor, subunit CAF1/NURF55/MSI1 [Plasmopara halstedii]